MDPQTCWCYICRESTFIVAFQTFVSHRCLKSGEFNRCLFSLCSPQFGGKLVSLENTKPNPQQPQQPGSHVVYVSQVVTETEFLMRSEQLQATLGAGSFVDFCNGKIDAAGNEFEKTVWAFLKVRRKTLFSHVSLNNNCSSFSRDSDCLFLSFQANFESDIRGKYLELLGYNKEELALKVRF